MKKAQKEHAYKHTPAPWEIHDREVISKVPGSTMAIPVAAVPLRNFDADARLIAAAPDLLEALRRLELAVLHNGDWDDGCFYHNGTSSPELQQPLEAARAAISKAQGAA